MKIDACCLVRKKKRTHTGEALHHLIPYLNIWGCNRDASSPGVCSSFTTPSSVRRSSRTLWYFGKSPELTDLFTTTTAATLRRTRLCALWIFSPVIQLQLTQHWNSAISYNNNNDITTVLLSQVYLTLQGHDGACGAVAAVAKQTPQFNLGLKVHTGVKLTAQQRVWESNTHIYKYMNTSPWSVLPTDISLYLEFVKHS